MSLKRLVPENEIATKKNYWVMPKEPRSQPERVPNGQSGNALSNKILIILHYYY